MGKEQTAGAFKGKQIILWTSALIIGGFLGTLGIPYLNNFFNFIASVYTRLFKFVAVPTIALAVLTTLATLGAKKSTGKIFLRTIIYTFATTLVAALVGVLLYKIIQPGNLPAELVQQGQQTAAGELGGTTFYNHILSVVPDNMITPFSSGNVLSVILVAVACGLAISAAKGSENVQILLKGILGLQEVLFTLIRALVWALPLGVVAFSAQLSKDISAGVAAESLGKYVAVVLGGNVLQFFVVMPLFMLLSRVNPLKVFRGMLPAVLMALFTKSSAATLPVTIASAENNLKAKKEVSRFILPICCTINMNGCAAFILITSLFVLQNGGVPLTFGTVALWVLISVFSAVGNAGVPMGCYFLTLSLMSGVGGPIGIMGVILPIYAVIDMIETSVNVWSDSCICAIVDKQLTAEDVAE
ncbi:MAG: dicarboxylate/amino acid:cation symporter [Lentisphaeria bacterium]|nr:dicarboxylate/amino acid:cation symporter [Lentisphaerota bacterium]MBR2625372.1 dicarboxylate/amino acid:cation symporter [Lentisphaeria bacterium]